MDAVAQISRAAHIAISPLTAPEAVEYGKMYASDDKETKRRVVMSLAKFGYQGASQAAQQVAPKDDALQGLIGLATGRNRVVAANHVAQVLTGQDIVKGNKDLIKTDEAAGRYQDFLGNALFFYPDLSRGVGSNANAILAVDAHQRGAHTWADAQGAKGQRVFAALNSALGAYSQDGKQYGGLTTFNGATTILPDSMSHEDFERRISRANATQFKAAHNGTPVYADGSSPASDVLKRMQWVPVGDGVYRLTDGHRFMSKKDGGFYQIDVRKLP